jgi:hypothetical protein
LTRAELALSVLMRPGVDRSIPDEETLRREVPAYEARRNDARAALDWPFTWQDARVQRHRLSPSISE